MAIDLHEHNYDATDDEAEVAQTHSIHLSLNAVGQVQRELELQRSRPSLSHCEECGDEIPVARQQAIRGVRTCIFCKEAAELRSRL